MNPVNCVSLITCVQCLLLGVWYVFVAIFCDRSYWLPSYFIITVFFFIKKNQYGYCNRLCRPSGTLSPPKSLDEIQPLVWELLTWMGHAEVQFYFGPAPLWLRGESNKSNIIKFQLQRFFNRTLCVFSQIKGIKHIRRDFHSSATAMSQGWDSGVLGQKINFLNMVMWHIKLKEMTSRTGYK